MWGPHLLSCDEEVPGQQVAHSMKEEEAVGQATGVAGPTPSLQQRVPLAGVLKGHDIVSIETPFTATAEGEGRRLARQRAGHVIVRTREREGSTGQSRAQTPDPANFARFN